ncbi:MAG: alpha/beta hydrolase [Anaerolineaceae bacterium]|nr:alpha/beta hydrolase [Anaerolineaceae bacterium]
MNSKIANTNLGPIEYTLEGEGEPVLIIHGGNGDCFINIRQKQLIEEGYQVLIPSRPGYGKTPIDLGKTAAEQAIVMNTLLEFLNIQKVAVIATSAGGPTALEFARQYADKTCCLLMEEAISNTWVSKWSPIYWGMKYMMSPKRISKLWENERREFDTNQVKNLTALAKRFSTLKPEEVLNQWDDEDLAFYREMLFSFSSGPGMIYTMDHKAKHIDQISVPVLIMHSPYDKNVPYRHAMYTHKKIKNSKLIKLPGLSHLIYMGIGKDVVIKNRLAFLKVYS